MVPGDGLIALAIIEDNPHIGRAIHKICQAMQIDFQSIAVYLSSDIPPGAGLGSSAALCVAITKELATYTQREISTGDIFSIAQKGETVFHTSPSGIDVAVSLFGGVGTFTKQPDTKQPDTKQTDTKQTDTKQTGWQPLSNAFPKKDWTLVVGNSGHPGSTAKQVTKVSRRLHRKKVSNALEQIGILTKEGTNLLTGTLSETSAYRFGQIMTECHTHLQSIGVSTTRLDQMVLSALKNNAFGAKLTGGGGGGCAIALTTQHNACVIAQGWKDLGFDSFITGIGTGSQTMADIIPKWDSKQVYAYHYADFDEQFDKQEFESETHGLANDE